MILSLPIGILLSAALGWLLLELLQGKTRVLWRGEQWTLGYVLGLTFLTFLMFVAHVVTGMPLSLWGFMGVMTGSLIFLAVPWMMMRRRDPHPSLPEHPSPSPTVPLLVRVTFFVFSGWIALRLIVFVALSFVTPSYFDDTMDNWNLRGKLFFVDQAMTLVLPWDQNAQGVSSYPPSVPLSKTLFASIAGEWNDQMANVIHVFWFIALLLLVYWTLRRTLPWTWSLTGVLALASLPLEFIQGTGTYADVFLSAHLFAPVMMMFRALQCRTRERALPWLRLGAFAIAVVPFTKNEGFVLYFPVLLLLYGGTLLSLRKKNVMTGRDLLRMTACAMFCIAAITIPWIGYKVLNGLTFGNAKGIDFNFAWQPGVLTAILVNTFLEANWNFLFPLFFGLLALRWKAALRSPLILLTAFFAIPYFGQLFFYLFTGLGQEALFQTGYARGLIHLMPIVITLTVLLLHDMMQGTKGTGGT